jgi:N-acetylneuraminic acid mutarotase
MAWQRLAPLPVARFAPVLEYLDGNLHLISGATEDRETICADHFVMKIRDRDDEVSSLPDLEKQVWREGPPVPEGGDHAGSIIYDSRIYMIGGEHGHAGLTMDAATCCGTYWAHNFVFRYDPRTEQWERLADLLFSTSHIESQILIVDDRFVVLGGTGDQDILVDRVQQYDPAENSWTELSPLPQGRKGGLVWEWNDVVYFNGGQIGERFGTQVVETTMSSRIVRQG